MTQRFADRSLGSWERSASGWAVASRRLSEAAQTVTDWLVSKVAPRPGQCVLDLAAGAGDTGYQVARQLGPKGRLITTDFSPAMLAEAKRRADECAVDNVEFRVLDAEHMDLEDECVDSVLCRYGYMLMADPTAALRETRRVLKRGGRVAFATFTEPKRNPWALFGRLLVERGAMPPPAAGKPGIFGLPDPELVQRIASEAGFSEIEVGEIAFVWKFEDFDEYWEFATKGAGAVAAVLDAMSDAALADYRAELVAKTAPFRREHGALRFAASSLVVAAER
jgi:ubiquinone/menaquinone biosynthesis C-methylase UbiE